MKIGDTVFGQLAVYVAVLRYCLCTTKNIRFQRHSTASASCRLSAPLKLLEGLGSQECLALCNDKETCLAINYHTETRRCELVGKNGYFAGYATEGTDGWIVYSNVKADTIYQHCGTNDDCLEPNSRCIPAQHWHAMCFCEPMFEYSKTERRCKTVCESYGGSFTEYNDTCIGGYDLECHEGQSFEICKLRCTQQGNDCQSFDMIGSDCCIKKVTKEEAMQVNVLSSGCVHYSRNCDDDSTSGDH